MPFGIIIEGITSKLLLSRGRHILGIFSRMVGTPCSYPHKYKRVGEALGFCKIGLFFP